MLQYCLPSSAITLPLWTSTSYIYNSACQTSFQRPLFLPLFLSLHKILLIAFKRVNAIWLSSFSGFLLESLFWLLFFFFSSLEIQSFLVCSSVTSVIFSFTSSFFLKFLWHSHAYSSLLVFLKIFPLICFNQNNKHFVIYLFLSSNT